MEKEEVEDGGGSCTEVQYLTATMGVCWGTEWGNLIDQGSANHVDSING